MTGFIAGPFHASFKELVLTKIWHDELIKIELNSQLDICISVAPPQLNYAIGFKGGNRGILQKKYEKVKFLQDSALSGYQYHVSYH